MMESTPAGSLPAGVLFAVDMNNIHSNMHENRQLHQLKQKETPYSVEINYKIVFAFYELQVNNYEHPKSKRNASP